MHILFPYTVCDRYVYALVAYSEVWPMEDSRIDIMPATIAAIVARHRLGTRTFAPLASLGTATTIYLLGDAYILRVPHNHPAAIAGIRTDPFTIPAARSAGVRTPQLIAFDDRADLLPVPYGVYERVLGEPLDRLGLPREATPHVWRELGYDLARLHMGVSLDGPASQIGCVDETIEPRMWLREIIANHLITSEVAEWLLAWLDRLEPFARVPLGQRFCHGDVNAGNIMVDPETHEYLALVDWGGAFWGDATWDFVPVSLRAVPLMLESYRAMTPLDNDATAEARILWLHVGFTVFGLWKEQQRGQSWALQRVAQLRMNLQGFVTLPTTRWIAELR